MYAEFINIFERVHQLLKTCPDPHSRQTDASWSIKEILGHLIDSASNNYQRLQRYVPRGELRFPGYDPEGDLESKITVGDNPATSIDQLMADYFAHMVLHENQVKEVLAG